MNAPLSHTPKAKRLTAGRATWASLFKAAKDVSRAARNIAISLRLPPQFPPGHYYSPLTNPRDVQRAVEWGETQEEPVGVKVDHAEMQELATELAPMWPQLDLSGRYYPSDMFGKSDAAVYHSILRRFRPQRIIEVGSGFSTAVALDTIDSFDLEARVTCIEPYPERLQSLLREHDDVDLHRKFVQDVPVETYDELMPNDILFIDSSHVVKSGSDVVWTTLRVLPRLKAGVLVHIHDIFWPFEYQASWLRQRRDWTEIYLVHAFLSGNPEFEVLFFNDFAWMTYPDLVQRFAPDTVHHRPGSLWLRRTEHFQEGD